MIPAHVRASLAALWRFPGQSALAVLGVALGVMVFVSVEVANDGARRAFSLSMDTLAGRATHQIVAGPAGVPERLYVHLRRDLGLRPLAPVVEALVRHEHRTLRLLGVDPFAEQAFRPFLSAAEMDSQAWRSVLLEPGAVLLGARTARELGLAPGARWPVQISGRTEWLTLAGVLDDSASVGMADLVIVDIASAQEITRRLGRLTRIEVAAGDDPTLLARVREALPAGTRLVSASTRARAMLELSRAFSINLTAMSLLAVVIGMFLIYNTVSFTVLRRRELFGALRAVGVGRMQLFAAILLEAGLLGLLASALGIGAGAALAGYLLQLIGRTINDLYFVLNVGDAGLTVPSAVAGLVLGLGSTALAALVPASEAAASEPRTAMLRARIEGRALAWVPRLAFAGLFLLTVSALLALLTRSLAGGYAALAALLIGYSLLTPWATARLVRASLRVLRGAPAVLRHAVSGIGAGLSRTGVAIAALVVALAATVGVATMIGSFRTAVQDWLGSTLRADVYVVPVAAASGQPETLLEEALVAAVRGLEGVEQLSLGRYVELSEGGRLLPLLAIEMAPRSYAGISLLAGGAGAWEAFDRDDAVLVSEPYAYHQRLAAGDVLELPTARGERAFRVAGIYRDYGSDHGVILLRRSLYRDYWDDSGLSSMGVYLRPGTALPPVMKAIRAAAGGLQQVHVRSNRDLREASLAVFDRTFEITRVLRWLTVIVAVVGILTALTALELERRRELAVLRSLGLTASQLGVLLTLQTGLLGLLAGVLAVPLGMGLSQLLIHVINRRAFGWSMEFVLQPGALWQALALATGTALVAGVLPAWRAVRVPPARALRAE